MVSVIVPVYNTEKYITECIESIINQTYKNIEIILVNDGSTDNSGKICDKFAQFDSRVKVYHNNNMGPSSARNYGIGKSLGEYVTFVDSDDYISNNTIEKCVDAFDKSNYDMVVFNHCQFNDNYNKEIIMLDGENRDFGKKDIEFLERLLIIPGKITRNSNLSIAGSVCKMYKLKILKECCFPIKIDYGEDICFAAQVLRRVNKVMYLKDVLYHYRILPDSLSHNEKSNYLHRKINFVNWIVDFYKNDKEEDFLNEFCFKSYVEVTSYVFNRRKLRYREKKLISNQFMMDINYEYNFDDIDYRCKNKNLEIMRFLIIKKKHIVFSIISKLIQLKNKGKA